MALTTVRPQGMGFVTGRRNLIINGAMQVSQRGTSETGITAGKYANAPDRFSIGLGGAGTWTAAQSTDAPDGFSNSYRLDCTTANASLSTGNLLILQQAIEGQNLQHLKKGTSSAESVTVSFYVKSNKTGTYIAELYDADNSRQISQAYTISSANTWEKKTLTYAGDTSGALDNDNAVSLYLLFWLAAGSGYSSGTLSTSWTANTQTNRAVGQVNLADSTDNDWSITGVQLEVGTNASDFEHRSFGEEWHLCQRYCTVYHIGGGGPHDENNILEHNSPPGKPGHVDVNNRGEWQLEYGPKRTAPTITFTDGSNMRWQVGNNGVVNANASPALSVGTSANSAIVFQGVASGITLGSSNVSHIIVGWLKQASGNNPKIFVDAEL